ncbi:NAD(P)H-hydrate dehydratase [uncultured Erythrobacter sp.]|uniref:NAD(P)H-hydrate dehydratase n=1 Tax=uncultured Erythrobacter sp. TaxID=263913 RepID=UPI0026290E36|nr:NAD(P)H-hydrate dehydratase [uncultured Erythrobacter sp.]
MNDSQILTAAQMRAAEQALFDAGTSVTRLMEVAAGGAAEWIRRIACGRSVTVLCGPGNNGGDGYVIARLLRQAGNEVRLIAPVDPKTDAAREARSKWTGEVLTSGGSVHGGIFVDCLFGSGLARPLSGEHALLLRDLASHHALSVAVDLPSGIASDDGALLNEPLPNYDVTLALGAWKYAHWCLPGSSVMGAKRLVPIGIEAVEGAAQLVTRPSLTPPALDAHKYTRGLAVIIGGEMPGAATLAASAAQRAGAGYVKLLAEGHVSLDPGLVCEGTPLVDAISDRRISALLIGPGLGRDAGAKQKLEAALGAGVPSVLDADALMLLQPDMLRKDQLCLATPHEGELEALCRSCSVIAEGRRNRAQALAQASGMVVLAKGPDTVIAAPDGRIALAPRAPSWLSVAGSGDVLAGIAVSRMASGRGPFEAACEAVWLHSRAARISGPAFTAEELANNTSKALERCL